MEGKKDVMDTVESVTSKTIEVAETVAKSVVSLANTVNTKVVIPTVSKGAKALSSNEKTKEKIDKVSCAFTYGADTAAKVTTDVLKASAGLMTDTVFPAVKDTVNHVRELLKK